MTRLPMLLALALAWLTLAAAAGCDHPGPVAVRAGDARSAKAPRFEPLLAAGPPSAIQRVAAEVSAAAPAAPSAPPEPEVRAPTRWRADTAWTPNQRLAHAKKARLPTVKGLFREAGVAFPAKQVLFRIFKQEAEVEVWAGDGADPLRRVATYGICAASGVLGPKRAEGDLQVPEGFYRFGYFAPGSAYYLAALIDYPNLSDRVRGGATPGGQILMHGSCASIGCVSMTDERMEELYLMAWESWRTGGERAHVHIFPARDLGALLEDPALAEHHAFWREIAVGHDAFEATHRLPKVRIERDGRYQFTASR